MKIYSVIETYDVEIVGLHLFSDREKALECFQQIVNENHLQEMEDTRRELEGTLSVAGDDSCCVQLIERTLA